MVGNLIAAFWLNLLTDSEKFDSNSVAAIAIDPIELPHPLEDIDAEFDTNVDYPKQLKVKLLETGEFHADEVPYRSGEKWLGLFKVGDSYQLVETRIRKARLVDDGLYDTSVKTTTLGEPVFLLRGGQELVPGEVDTVFDSQFDDVNFGYFTDSAPKGFGLRGRFWKLRVDNLNSSGFPGKNTSLVLEDGFHEQVLRYLKDGCDDCGWSVDWVGDLNRDGQLDFLIDLSGHYNSSEPTLFLSTEPDSDKIVRIYAAFHKVGC